MTQRQSTQQMAPQFNELMPQMGIQSASMFHSIARIEVLISTILGDKEIYPQGYDDGVQRFALTGNAIAKLATAAGINRIQGEDVRTDDRKHPHITSWHWAGEWVQPDGTTLKLSGDYTLDLRDWIVTEDGKVRGPRFEEFVNTARQKVLLGRMQAAKIEIPKGFEAKAEAALKYLATLSEAEQKGIETAGEASALRTISQLRVHVATRAQTGAMLRALRKLLQLKSTYTMLELQRPFVVYRSRFDFDRMTQVLGVEQVKRLALAAATNILGISADTLRAILPAQGETSAAPDTPKVAESATIATPAPKVTAPESGVPEFDPFAFAEEGVMPVTESTTPVATVIEVAEMKQEHGAEKFIALPWRDGAKAFPEDKLDPVGDKALIDRAKRNITPLPHLNKHLQVHYGVKRWSEMKYQQAVTLWTYLDDIASLAEAKEFRELYRIYGDPSGVQVEFWQAMKPIEDKTILAPLFKDRALWASGPFLVSLAQLVAGGKLMPGTPEFDAALAGMNK